MSLSLNPYQSKDSCMSHKESISLCKYTQLNHSYFRGSGEHEELCVCIMYFIPSSMQLLSSVLFCCVQLTSSPLDPHGPFDMRNALRSLSSTATHTLVFQYTPQQAGKVRTHSMFQNGQWNPRIRGLHSRSVH